MLIGEMKLGNEQKDKCPREIPHDSSPCLCDTLVFSVLWCIGVYDTEKWDGECTDGLESHLDKGYLRVDTLKW